jgi:phosphomannomutase
MKESLKYLQNGSDIRGVAIGGVQGEEVNLTIEIAECFGKAFATWLALKNNMHLDALRIAVGMDSRLSGPELSRAFIEGVTLVGANVLDAGLATTPAMFMATQFIETKCHGAVMLTASHLPFNRNGFKFFTNHSGLEKGDITQLISMVEDDNWMVSEHPGQVKQIDLIGIYANHICSIIQKSTNTVKPLKNKRILVDAGNGAGGFFATRILDSLGADITGSLFLVPDGNFPNHTPNPEDDHAISFLIEAVIKEEADLGIIFDTDVDRAAIVDETGTPIHRNRLIALLSAIVLNEHKGSTIVTDSVTSDGLTTFIEEKGGKHFRYKRGYRNVINKSIELNNEGLESWLAIETSGHAAFKENYFLDDGAFLVAKILIAFSLTSDKATKPGDLIADLEEPVEAREFRIPITKNEFIEYGTEVLDQLTTFSNLHAGWKMAPENYEGVRIQCDKSNGDGWFLLRLSLHDPVLPLNIESNSEGGVSYISSILMTFFKDFQYLNLESLR